MSTDHHSEEKPIANDAFKEEEDHTNPNQIVRDEGVIDNDPEVGLPNNNFCFTKDDFIETRN